MPRRTWDFIRIADSFLDSFAYVVRLDVNVVEQMLLTNYVGKVISKQRFDRYNKTLAASSLLLGSWIEREVSSMCPECLKENGGAWRLDWMMPWSFLCLKHKALLILFCPSCKEPLGPKNHYKKQINGYRFDAPRPGFCNHIGKGQSKRGKKAQQCNHVLTDVPSVNLSARHSLLQSQLYINEAMEGMQKLLAGNMVPSVVYINAIKFICLELKRVASLEDLGEFPIEFKASIEEEFYKLDEFSSSRGRNAAGTYFRSKAVMAVLVPRAIQIASVPSPEKFVTELADIYDNIYDSREISLRRIRSLASRSILPDYLIKAVYRLFERSDRDKGLSYDFTEKRKVKSSTTRRLRRPSRLTPNQFEALRQQIIDNEGLSAREQAKLFEAEHGVALNQGNIYNYLKRWGFKSQKSTLTGKRIWRET